MKFAVSIGAQRNLDQIFVYWAERISVEVADRIVNSILERFKLLAKFPNLGRKCDELRPGTYRFSAGQYLIYYQKLGTSIEIVRVYHGARDQDQLF